MNLKTYYMDKSINYQESLCEDEMIQKYYLIRNPEHVSFVTIPDGCVDIQFMFRENKKTACISGSPVTPRNSLYTNQDWIFGIKLNPGVLPVAMSQDAIGIPECYIDITEQEGIMDILCGLEKLASASGNSELEKLASVSGNRRLEKLASASGNSALEKLASASGNSGLEKLASASGNRRLEKLASASGNSASVKNADATLNISVSPDMLVSQDIHISPDLTVSRDTHISPDLTVSRDTHISPDLPVLSDMISLTTPIVKRMISGCKNPLVSNALHEILHQEGCVKMAQIADNMKYSQHYINREFKKNTGFSLKQYSEIIRLQSAITYLEKENVDFVYDKLGYYDQAHFIKEFKKFTLLTPQNYLRKKIQRSFV